MCKRSLGILSCFIVISISALVLSTSVGCSKKNVAADVDYSDWGAVVAAARGTTVSYVGYGGDDALNEWIIGPYTDALKKKYDITLKYTQNMDISTQLASEKLTGIDRGMYDVCWINGLMFRSERQNDLLFGPFTGYLPNFANYIDPSASETLYDFTYPIEGYEAPFSKAQIILINDKAVTSERPANSKELLDYAKKYRGRVSYPSLEHFTGAAFVRTIIYDICGHESFINMKEDYETVHKAVEPAMKYLRDLNPHLWMQGKTFPALLSDVDNMFINGELVLMMSYGIYDVGGKIKKGIYTPTTQAFCFDNGTVSNASYYAIPFNAPNKAGALTAINEMLSPQMQLAKLATGEEPYVIDLSRLTEEERDKFEAVDMGPNNLSAEYLLSKSLPEYSAAIESIVTEIWLKEVVGKTND
ncbi:MAG: ABC transporter substrate-binding protein [Termitinemataceae bacterium]|nr:MAG: ABC transporter substrate-binding protein [Termitinemataceae bacterium]